MCVRNFFVFLLVATILGHQTMRTARAEMLVVESNVPEIPIGTHLTDKPELKLPPGGRVRVLLSSHESKVFERSGATMRTPGAVGGTRAPRRPD
jgi:hypothetical protein